MKHGARIHTITSRGKTSSSGQNRTMGIHIAASSDESRLLICSVLLDQKFVGVVEDTAIALGGGTGVDAADGLRDGRNDEKPPLGKRMGSSTFNDHRTPSSSLTEKTP